MKKIVLIIILISLLGSIFYIIYNAFFLYPPAPPHINPYRDFDVYGQIIQVPKSELDIYFEKGRYLGLLCDNPTLVFTSDGFQQIGDYCYIEFIELVDELWSKLAVKHDFYESHTFYLAFIFDNAVIFIVVILLIITLCVVSFIRNGKSKKVALSTVFEYSHKYDRGIPVTHVKNEQHTRYLDDDQLAMFVLYSKLSVEEREQVKAKMVEIIQEYNKIPFNKEKANTNSDLEWLVQ